MSTSTKQSLQDTLTRLASEEPDRFKLSFRRLRAASPKHATEACLWYIAAQKADSVTRQMAAWLISDMSYLQVLFDPETLPLERAAQAIAPLRAADPTFCVKFYKAAAELTDSKSIARALNLVSALGDYEIVLPLLRTCSHHTNERIRSKAVKLLCQLRPNKGSIERQMESKDPRVRASAMEALWYAKDPNSVTLLSTGLNDSHHRVLINALVGLYLHDDPGALNKMLDLACHPEALFRSAVAWAFGLIRNERAKPILEILATDSSAVVRKRALQSLLALHPPDSTETSPHEETVKCMKAAGFLR